MLDAITESGTVYRIDQEAGFWIRFPKGVPTLSSTTERIWTLKAGTDLCFPWQNEAAWDEADTPEVGKHLFISSRDVWYTSQKVVKVVEIDDWRAPVSQV